MKWLEGIRKEPKLRGESARQCRALCNIVRRSHGVICRQPYVVIDNGAIPHVENRIFSPWFSPIADVVDFLNACPALWTEANALARNINGQDERLYAEIDRLYRRLTDTPMGNLVRPSDKPK